MHCMASGLVLFFMIVSSISQTCDKPYDCSGQSLTTDNKLHINGYKSATGSATSFTGLKLYCHAAFSCHHMSHITADGTVACKSMHSCSNTTINLQVAVLFCYGFRSCSYSLLSSKDRVRCDGYQSCANSRIRDTASIVALGSYALYSAIIRSESVDSTIELHGELAAYGATFICDNARFCTIMCHGHDSCYMFYIECIGTCDVVVDAHDISPITNINQLYIDDTHYRNTIDIEAICNTHSGAITYDDYNDHMASAITIESSANSVCCRGRNSCKDSVITNIAATNANLICSGGFSCNNGNIYANNATVFCESADSCFNTKIYNAAFLYCWGYISCSSATITSSPYIVCDARDACTNAVIYSAGSNLELLFNGDRSGYGATVYCNETDWCNIKCSGSTACSLVNVICFGVCELDCDESSGCPIGWTASPTLSPTVASNISSITSSNPTVAPTNYPTVGPTNNPTSNPTQAPNTLPITSSPTKTPTAPPTKNPTIAPTILPTRKATRHPTSAPSQHPATTTTINPTSAPTKAPSQPSSDDKLRTTRGRDNVIEENDQDQDERIDTHNNDLFTGAIIATAIVSVVGTAICFIVIFLCCAYHKRKRKAHEQECAIEMTSTQSTANDTTTGGDHVTDDEPKETNNALPLEDAGLEMAVVSTTNDSNHVELSIIPGVYYEDEQNHVEAGEDDDECEERSEELYGGGATAGAPIATSGEGEVAVTVAQNLEVKPSAFVQQETSQLYEIAETKGGTKGETKGGTKH